jgi:hypothetical protein
LNHSKEEEAQVDKRRRDKEKVLKKKNDAKKKQKIEAGKAKPRAKDEAKAKAKAKEKVVAKKEKELAEVARVASELAEKSAKEAAHKVVEEERQKKSVKNRDNDTHPMDLGYPRNIHHKHRNRDNKQWFRP